MGPSTRTCIDLQSEIDSCLADGYRLDMIMPADDPRAAIVSKNGASLRLIKNHPVGEAPTPLLSKEGSFKGPPENGTQSSWIEGRAGMQYRDLIPDRLGGRVIASHIRITKGGEVPDYVHYHKIRFQMIYCKAGWIRVAYEDQGPPFVMNAGDCVLQPPGIRHRVLESSAGAEVIEVSAPSEHETWVEHELELPTGELKPDRNFGGQRFVLHRSDTTMSDARGITETEIEKATHGLATVRVVRLAAGDAYSADRFSELIFLYVLSGTVQPVGLNQTLHADEHGVFAHSTDGISVAASEDSDILEVRLREI